MKNGINEVTENAIITGLSLMFGIFITNIRYKLKRNKLRTKRMIAANSVRIDCLLFIKNFNNGRTKNNVANNEEKYPAISEPTTAKNPLGLIIKSAISIKMPIPKIHAINPTTTAKELIKTDFMLFLVRHKYYYALLRI